VEKLLKTTFYKLFATALKCLPDSQHNWDCLVHWLFKQIENGLHTPAHINLLLHT